MVRSRRAWRARSWSGRLHPGPIASTTAAEMIALADACAAHGDAEGEVAMLTDARRIAPDDLALLTRLRVRVRTAANMAAACAHLDAAGEVYDGDLFATAGELRARAGDLAAARGLFARLLAREPHRTQALIEQGLRIADPELALVHVEAAADGQLARGDTFGAIAAYRRFAERFPAICPRCSGSWISASTPGWSRKRLMPRPGSPTRTWRPAGRPRRAWSPRICSRDTRRILCTRIACAGRSSPSASCTSTH